MKDNSIAIVGGGFAGLAAGIYAQMNGFETQVFEMHTLPGGLCTAWKRRGYTIDGCIHWLVGSSPQSGLHRYWEEVGIAQGREFVNMDEFMRYEGADGRTLILYTNVDKLEKHLLEFSPQDEEPIFEFTQAIRMCFGLDPITASTPLFTKLRKGLRLGLLMATKGRAMQKWMRTTTSDFAARFKDQVLKEAFREMWFPDFSMLFLLFTLAYAHSKNAGYPIGGSLPMSLDLAKRYMDLGGQIHYGKRVERILVERDKAVGVQLADGSQYRAGQVISAADGYTTIFKLLGGKYADDKTREPYEKWPVFPPLLYVGVGVNRTFPDEAKIVSGTNIHLSEPKEIGEALRERLSIHIMNQDPTLAPSGKTVIAVTMNSDYRFWHDLATDRAAYEAQKGQVARAVVEVLEARFPGITEQVEMVDVATPHTFARYTGNWQGSYEGWLITPGNASAVIKRMSQTLPGLQNCYMCGQWVEPGGGLPTGIMSGRRLVQALCKKTGRKFCTTTDMEG